MPADSGLRDLRRRFEPHREQAHSYNGARIRCRSEPARDGTNPVQAYTNTCRVDAMYSWICFSTRG